MNAANNSFQPLSRSEFKYLEKTKDIIDQLIDLILNYRQSGHPGGSRSKNYIFLSLLLSGRMRWDIRDPLNKFGDRFILSAGHAVPLVYTTLAVLNEAMLLKYEQTRDEKYQFNVSEENILKRKDLLRFRRRGGLSGHAEMEGKTLFLKFNTGPSGHGMAAAVGEAFALKRAGAEGVKVFVMDGEGGLTTGITHEALNSAWGLNLKNLNVLVDWNDFGIDPRPFSQVVYGTPVDWFASHGWNVYGTQFGMDWESVLNTIEAAQTPEPDRKNSPIAMWFRTQKGRGYKKFDAPSHGSPHALNSELFWETKREFSEQYGVAFACGSTSGPFDQVSLDQEFEHNLGVVMSVLERDQELVNFLSGRLLQVAQCVPKVIEGFKLNSDRPPFEDPKLFDFRNYPEDIYVKPGDKAPNRAALAKWGAWINAYTAKNYGQPAFIACSADLSDSTNISGFGKGYGEFPGYGWAERVGTNDGVLLPQGITEALNAGLVAGLASVNFSEQPASEFRGFWGACSTYASFAYLKYGMFRLFSQLTQDCEAKMGKVLWVLGHSGPETADDSRTHYGIFSPIVSQLFPKGTIINLHPWEYNEVPVLLGEAFKQEGHIVALHLTRPPITIPDRKKLGIPSHFEASKGAYIVRDFDGNLAKDGTIFIQGTSTMISLCELLPRLEQEGLNVKLVYVASTELFNLQSEAFRDQIVNEDDKLNSTVFTTQARKSMCDWMFNSKSETFAVSADWDDRWRSGGNLEEALDEAHLTPKWIYQAIQRFVLANRKN